MDRYVARITWQRALKVFWAQAWRVSVVAVALVLLLMLTYGFLSPVLRGLIGIGESILRATLVGAVFLYASSWGMKRALQVQYSDFQIDTMPLEAIPSAESPVATAMTEWKALAVWWATFWRAWLITLPANFLSNYLIVGTPLPAGTTQLPLLLGTYAAQTVVAVAAGTWAIRIALQLDYRGWRLQLVSKLT